MKVLDVHGKTLTVGSAAEGINLVVSTGANKLIAADDANGVVLMGKTGDVLDAGKSRKTTLISNGGAKLIGNASDNLYVVSRSSDVIVEQANAGKDTVRSMVSYELPNHVENLTLTGTAAINGKGNGLNNTLEGNSAANVLDGGAGQDILSGGRGNDTYVFGLGYGQDVIVDQDATPGNTDVLSFTSGIVPLHLWFQRVHNDLQISVMSTTDKVTIQDWYKGSQNQIELIRAGGQTLLNTQVDRLVQAMATFVPTVSGQSPVTDMYQMACAQINLSPVIAASWK